MWFRVHYGRTRRTTAARTGCRRPRVRFLDDGRSSSGSLPQLLNTALDLHNERRAVISPDNMIVGSIHDALGVVIDRFRIPEERAYVNRYAQLIAHPGK